MASTGQGWADWPTGTSGESSSYPSSSVSAYRNSWRSQMPLDPAVYSVENFEPRPSQELVCTVCRGVYREPVECPCRHVFCGDCIRGWLTRGGTGNCPMCRRSTTLWQLVPVVPIVTNMICRLTVRCPNRNHGCFAKIALETLNRHVETCEFRQVPCPECGLPQRAGEVSKHRRERCPKRMVHCTRDCGFSLPADRAHEHSCVREMRHYIGTLERTRNCLRQQLEQANRNARRLERELRDFRTAGASGHSKYAGNIVGAVSLGSELRHCGGCDVCLGANASASGGSTPSNTSSLAGRDASSESQAQVAQRSVDPSPEATPEELAIATSSVTVTGTTSARPSTSRQVPRARTVVPTPTTTSLLLSSASAAARRRAAVAAGNSASVSALAAGLASALRLETAVDPGDVVTGTWEMVAAAISPQGAGGGAGEASDAAPNSQGNAEGAGGGGYRQVAGGDGYLSALMQRLWESGTIKGPRSPQ